LYGIKKYEYRKRFCNEQTIAYLYLSSPIQELIGIMELGKPIFLEEEIKSHDKFGEQYYRLNRCIENKEKYAIPIISFSMLKEPISINKIKAIAPDFSVPQCYLNIENYPKLLTFIDNCEFYPKEFIHNHDKIYDDNIGMLCSEMEKQKNLKLRIKNLLII
jgi:predicted transcriptional regulator